MCNMGVLLKFACAFIVFLTVVYYLMFGFAITSLGLYIKQVGYNEEPYVNHVEDAYSATVFITLGIEMLLISFIGGCGLITKNFYMTLLFTAILTLILFSEISLSLAAYVMVDEIKYFFLNWLPSIEMYHTSPDVHVIWDIVQEFVGCCGVRNSTDWKRVEDIAPIPESCYYYNTTSYTRQLHEIGCVEGVGNFLTEHSPCIITVGVILTIVQLIGIISACSLTRIYRKKSKLFKLQ